MTTTNIIRTNSLSPSLRFVGAWATGLAVMTLGATVGGAVPDAGLDQSRSAGPDRLVCVPAAWAAPAGEFALDSGGSGPSMVPRGLLRWN